jgi:hypothetical protein
MGIPDGAHTPGSGFDPGPILIVIGAILIGPAVAAAVAELLHIVLIVVAVLAVVAAAGLAAFVAWRLRHRRRSAPWQVQCITPAPARPSPLRSEPRPAIEAPRQVHLHLHGVSAEDIAAILARNHFPGGPS